MTSTPQLDTDAAEAMANSDVERRSQFLSNLLSVSTYLVSVLDPSELLTDLGRRVVEVVPAVQAGQLWLFDRQHSTLQIA